MKSKKDQTEALLRQGTAKLQSSNICLRKHHTSLQNKSVMEALKIFYVRYVISPVDKVNGNVENSCRKFYAPTFVRKLVFKLFFNQVGSTHILLYSCWTALTIFGSRV